MRSPEWIDWRSLALAILMVVAPAATQAGAQQLVYLVRHAERADEGAAVGQMERQTDPPLSTAGEARAERLAAMLGDAGITAVFATEYRRTQDTARHVADRVGADVQVHPAADTDGLVETLRSRRARDIVLVVGHSNTIPAIVQALGGPDISIAADEYDNIFVLVPSSGVVSRIRMPGTGP